MNYIEKRILLIILGILMLFCTGCWLIACLFAVGQLYNTYDLWLYLKDAPIAVLILIALFGSAIVLFVMAFRVKKPQGEQLTDDCPHYRYREDFKK